MSTVAEKALAMSVEYYGKLGIGENESILNTAKAFYDFLMETSHHFIKNDETKDNEKIGN